MKAILFLFLAATSTLADTSGRRDTPGTFTWKIFRPGSWANYDMKFDFGGRNIPARTMQMKVMLKSRTRKNATIETTTKYANQKARVQTKTRPLNSPGFWGPTSGWTPVSKKREVIKVAGRKFVCQRMEFKMNGKRGTTYILWVNPLIPGGIVRYVITHSVRGKYIITLELKKYERK